MVQEAVSYLQKNCQNQNCKTSPSLPVHRLVSLFPYRPTCVRTHNHGYELSFQTTPPPIHPLSFCPVHMLMAPRSSAQDRLTALAHSQVENKVKTQSQQGFSIPSQPRRGREEAPASPQLLLAIRVLLAVDSSMQPCDSPSSAGLEQVTTCLQRAVTVCSWWLTRRSPKELDPEHWETLPALCKWEKKEEGSFLLLHFFMVISAESKKGLQD